METRPGNWHDLFNALAWIAFPKAKAAINAQHAAMLAEGGEEEARRRSPARDALTLFDEGGVAVASSSPEMLRLIEDFEWKALFWERREELARKVRFVAFGHSLFEKVLEPFDGVVAKTVFLPVSDFFAMLPGAVAGRGGRRAPRGALRRPVALHLPQGDGAAAGARRPGVASRHRERVVLRHAAAAISGAKRGDGAPTAP